jgi:hypothetical protein
MERVTRVESVSTHETRGGNTRYVVRDSDGDEYTTFRPQIGNAAMGFEGKPARIEFHEEQRGNFTNVYLDAIAAAPESEVAGDLEPDEVGSRTGRLRTTEQTEGAGQHGQDAARDLEPERGARVGGRIVEVRPHLAGVVGDRQVADQRNSEHDDPRDDERDASGPRAAQPGPDRHHDGEEGHGHERVGVLVAPGDLAVLGLHGIGDRVLAAGPGDVHDDEVRDLAQEHEQARDCAK